MANHVKAFTYKPKIPKVLDGKCKQTIRKLGVSEGDSILFHGWKGRPYFSEWTWRFRATVTEVLPIEIFKEGAIFEGRFSVWAFKPMDDLAQLDGFERLKGMNYGESMGEYFNKNNKLPSITDWKCEPKGVDFQVIRWEDIEILTMGDE